MTDLAWLLPIVTGAFIAFNAYLTKRSFDQDARIRVLESQWSQVQRWTERIERKLDEL